MQGIKAHTHQERSGLVEELIPQLQQKFEENFLGLAADGSYARDEDLEYSDLELIVFLKALVGREETVRKIINGQLVVIVPETKDSFISKYKEITDVWYASGAGKLMPILNEKLINEINTFKPTNIEEKCLTQVEKRWPFYQEITAKVLNNINQKDREALSLSFSAMVKELLVLLAYLNQTPYITLGKYIPQARNFRLKPIGVDKLLDMFVEGKYQVEIKLVAQLSKVVFEDLEKICLDKGVVIYPDNKL